MFKNFLRHGDTQQAMQQASNLPINNGEIIVVPTPHMPCIPRTQALDNEILSQTVSGSTKKSDVTFREGLGENLPFEGVDYLGTGYDIIEGNPQGDSSYALDPGFRAPIIKLTWDQDAQHNSRDIARLVPTQGWGWPKVSCKHASTATQMSSVTDYKHSLDVDVSQSYEASGGGGIMGMEVEASASYSASLGVKQFRQDVVDKQSEMFEMKSYCVQYKFQLFNNAAELDVTKYFQSRVDKLPVKEGITFDGACAKHLCSTLYVPALDKYLVSTGSKIVLRAKPGKTGRWLFQKSMNDDGWYGERVYWVKSKDSWEITKSTKVLGRHQGKLVMKDKADEKNIEAAKKQVCVCEGMGVRRGV